MSNANEPVASAIVPSARLFDGKTTQPIIVQPMVVGDALHLAGAPPALVQPIALHTLRIAEPWRDTPTPVALPGGATLWLDGQCTELAAALHRYGQPYWRAHRLIESWRAVALCALALVALLVWIDRQGAGIAAQAVLHLVPNSVDRSVGERAMQVIDEHRLAPSQLPEHRRQALRQRFTQIVLREAPKVPIQLEFRRMKTEAGFNAFALPNGTIVMLDGMAHALTDDELQAVLCHELAHVQQRHAMQALARSVGLAAVSTMVLSDFSSTAVTALSGLQVLAHRRNAEREADAYAMGMLQRAGINPETMASVWRKLMQEQQRSGADAIPSWSSTHPATDERLHAVERAEKASRSDR